MNALSRREEDTLFKATKDRAYKACDSVIKDFADCATGRTVSVVWACKGKYKLVQECMYQYTNPAAMDEVREEYLRLRDAPPETTNPT
ncbi:cytochrome c oxidase biogenesis protein Cmc1 like-domain-containing protein [Pterulicium gracile]|uniref:COX assembly mitochondrial protein n=1 Tax=Pterulicium gracile TaxID=1884261 RepID=A0A5C3QX72_9AGAR|nr:cytochrome c oxidase biogenesis protein Cmc1 like-domain-containing protein [Pterula gracilis]